MTLNFAPAQLKVVPMRQVSTEIPLSYFGAKKDRPDISKPGLEIHTFSSFAPLLAKGRILSYSEFANLKQDAPEIASRLVNEVVDQSGILAFSTYIFNKPLDAQSNLNYWNGEVFYTMQLPQEISALLNTGVVALDFLKSSGNISFTRKGADTVWVYLSISDETNQAVYQAPSKGVPESYFGLAAINYLPIYDAHLVPHYAGFQSGPFDINKASVILKPVPPKEETKAPESEQLEIDLSFKSSSRALQS